MRRSDDGEKDDYSKSKTFPGFNDFDHSFLSQNDTPILTELYTLRGAAISWRA